MINIFQISMFYLLIAYVEYSLGSFSRSPVLISFTETFLVLNSWPAVLKFGFGTAGVLTLGQQGWS